MSDPSTPDAPRGPEVPQVPQVPDPVPAQPGGGAPTPPVYGAPTPTPPPILGAPTAPPPPGYGAPTPPAPGYGAPAQPAYGAPANAYLGAPPAKQPLLSILSLVAGLIGLIGFPVVAFIPIAGGIFGLFIPAAAIVLGFLGQKKEPAAKGFWLTGIITGFVGIGLALASIIVWVLVFANIPASYMN